MSIPKIAKAMNYIDDDLVSDAIEYRREKKKNIWVKWGAMAACLCCALFLGGFTVFALMQADVLPVVDSSDIPYEEIDHGNEGLWSKNEAFDVFGSFALNENMNVESNVDISKELNLKKGESNTWSLDIGSGRTGTAQDTVVIEVLNNSGTEFRYICEDVTNDVELANFSSIEDISRVLSNLNPEHQYEITIINLSVTQLDLDIKITSYHSENGELNIK